MERLTVLGGARENLKRHGKSPGRPQQDLIDAVERVFSRKRGNGSGSVTTLCVSPANGSRLPCDVVAVRQSLVGDCQSAAGEQVAASARMKNDGALLGEENVLVESLLAAVSVGDEEVVREMVAGAEAPRVAEVWATGDNLYVSGLDMSWTSFGIGDLLLLPGAVLVNSGYPHFACWKYAVRAGEEPKKYINSAQGSALRLRGIKAAVLLPAAGAPAIHVGDAIRIVRRDTPEYSRALQSCRTPLDPGADLIYRTEDPGQELRAAADNVEKYVELLVRAGCDAARLDARRYKRELPAVMERALGLGLPHNGDNGGGAAIRTMPKPKL